MEIIGLILSLIAGLSTLIGYFITYIKFKNIEKLITITLTGSMIIILLISIIDLLIPNIHSINLFSTILIFITGLILTHIISSYLDKKSRETSNLLKIGIISTICLILHNIPEGIIVLISSMNNTQIGIKTTLSIMLHNIPEGIIISIPLLYSRVGKKKVFILTLIASLSEPLGALLSYLILNKSIISTLPYISILTSGIMISLCINIFNEIKNTKYKSLSILSALICIIIYLILSSMQIMN